MSITKFYLLPVEQAGNARGPRYLRWRFGQGVAAAWSLKDFGDAPIALVASEAEINRPDALRLDDWSSQSREQIRACLRSAGLEPQWVCGADNWREGLHRLAGLALAHQSGRDEPEVWLGRDIFCGPVKLAALWRREVIRQSIIPYLRVRDRFRPGWNWSAWLRALALLPLAALPATDAFTAANGTALQTYNAAWVINSGALAINTNAVYGNSAGNDSLAHWGNDTFNADQYAQGTIAAISAGNWIGVSVRDAASAMTGYLYYGDNGNRTLAKYVNGTYTDLGLYNGGGFTASDLIRLEVSGTTLTSKRNGAGDTNTGPQTDNSIASGSGGLAAYNNNSGSRLDDWEGGNIGGDPVPPLFNKNMFQHPIIRM